MDYRNPNPDPTAQAHVPPHPWRTIRTLRAWSQSDVARAVRVDRAHYSRIESGEGRASPHLTGRLIEVLGPGVPVNWRRLTPHLTAAETAHALVPAPIIDAHVGALRLLGPWYKAAQDLIGLLGLDPATALQKTLYPPTDVIRGLVWWGCAGVWSWTRQIPQPPATEQGWTEWAAGLDHEPPIPVLGPSPDYGQQDILTVWPDLDREARDLLIALAKQLARHRR